MNSQPAEILKTLKTNSNPEGDPILLRILTQNDLNAIVNIHLRAFPESALTALGEEALRRYYLWQLTGPHDVLPLGAFLHNECLGYCFGGTFRGAMAGFIRQNRPYLIWRILTHPGLLLHRVLRIRLHYGLRRSRSAPVVTASPTGKICGILAIAVNPLFQGKGIGQKLMAQTEMWAKEQGFAAMRLTVHPENVRAINFYERLGWERSPGDEANWNGLMRKSLETASHLREHSPESAAR